MSEQASLQVTSEEPTPMQTRTEHSRSLDDAERYKALDVLREVGLLIPLKEVETFHGRTAQAEETDWQVDPSFANGGDDSGNGNINKRPTLYTTDKQTAKEFADQRGLDVARSDTRRVLSNVIATTEDPVDIRRAAHFRRYKGLKTHASAKTLDKKTQKFVDIYTDVPPLDETPEWKSGEAYDEARRRMIDGEEDAQRILEEQKKNWRLDVHEISTSDTDAMILDFDFNVDALDKEQRAKYFGALKSLLILPTEGSPVDFRDRDSIWPIINEVNKIDKPYVLASDISEIVAASGVDEETVVHLTGALNAYQLAQVKPSYLVSTLMDTKADIFIASLELDGSKQEIPLNLEYVQRYLRENHIVGARHSVNSDTVGKSITAISFFDLEKVGVFAPTGKGEPYSMVMPPPNANAPLHIGHSLNYSIMDIIARYQRSKGKSVLFLPGADHAGFETQVVYEKKLSAEGKSRFDFSREELYKQIYDYVEENKTTFANQLRSFGTSCDWDFYTYTLDEKVVKTAYSTFKKMWNDGLIYRGERLVNYCTQHQTGFADIEVVYEDRVTPLYYLKYGPFTLATTRPETKFGDTAVAVHPDDKRYTKYIDTVITAEGINGPFKIRVIADEYVDPKFGTGAVKITPAHDLNDWEVAQRHKLPVVKVINLDGTMNHKAGRFEGMPVLKAREEIVKILKEKDLLEKVDEEYHNRVGTCYKCGTVIEPMLLDQWFIDMKKLSEPVIKALKANKVTFYPGAKKQQTINYLENVRDWNISRQIAWGIPIPAFQNVDDKDDWIFDDKVEKETIEVKGKTYKRDTDVFDTWFSSSHWPFVTLDFPDGNAFRDYYPNSLMETGIDILYQWVARMLCMGLYVTGEVPFKQVYLHGMVRSEDGRKMSKSLGNVINPHSVIEQYGADALRMGIISGRSAGESSAYAPAKVVAGRNFCNKLWNVARFVENSLAKNKDAHVTAITPADHWVLSKLQHTLKAVSSHMDNYRLSEAYEEVYHFTWDDFADWYIEGSKRELNPGVLRYVLESSLKLAHPFAPFVTETIWQTLEWTGDSLIANELWPKTHKPELARVHEYDEIIKIVSEVRAIVSALQISKTSLYFTGVPFLSEHSDLIAQLARIDGVHEVEAGKGLHLTTTSHNCWLDVDRETTEVYVQKLKKQLEEAKNVVEGYKKRLANAAYVKKAPKELVEETKKYLEQAKTLSANTEKEIARFGTPIID